MAGRGGAETRTPQMCALHYASTGLTDRRGMGMLNPDLGFSSAC